MNHDTNPKTNQRHRKSRSVSQSVPGNRGEYLRSTGNGHRKTDRAGGYVDSKTLAHVFERELADYLKSGDGCRSGKVPFIPQGLVGKMIAAEPFSEKSLQAMADHYIGAHLNYGGRCRKSYLDGMHDILTLIYEIQNQG